MRGWCFGRVYDERVCDEKVCESGAHSVGDERVCESGAYSVCDERVCRHHTRTGILLLQLTQHPYKLDHRHLRLPPWRHRRGLF